MCSERRFSVVVLALITVLVNFLFFGGCGARRQMVHVGGHTITITNAEVKADVLVSVSEGTDTTEVALLSKLQSHTIKSSSNEGETSTPFTLRVYQNNKGKKGKPEGTFTLSYPDYKRDDRYDFYFQHVRNVQKVRALPVKVRGPDFFWSPRVYRR